MWLPRRPFLEPGSPSSASALPSARGLILEIRLLLLSQLYFPPWRSSSGENRVLHMLSRRLNIRWKSVRELHYCKPFSSFMIESGGYVCIWNITNSKHAYWFLKIIGSTKQMSLAQRLCDFFIELTWDCCDFYWFKSPIAIAHDSSAYLVSSLSSCIKDFWRLIWKGTASVWVVIGKLKNLRTTC